MYSVCLLSNVSNPAALSSPENFWKVEGYPIGDIDDVPSEETFYPGFMPLDQHIRMRLEDNNYTDNRGGHSTEIHLRVWFENGDTVRVTAPSGFVFDAEDIDSNFTIDIVRCVDSE